MRNNLRKVTLKDSECLELCICIPIYPNGYVDVNVCVLMASECF